METPFVKIKIATKSRIAGIFTTYFEGDKNHALEKSVSAECKRSTGEELCQSINFQYRLDKFPI